MIQLVLLIFSVIIFIFLINKNYYRINLLYNWGMISPCTPDRFKTKIRLSKTDLDEYNKRIAMGVREIRKNNVVICALVRDVSNNINHIKTKVNDLIHMFNDYRVLIVENDSQDDTREQLLEWSKQDPKIIILGCGYNVDKCTIAQAISKTKEHSPDKERINKMATLRNIYLDEIKKYYAPIQGSSEYWKYCIFWDLDIYGSVYLDGISNSFGYFGSKSFNGGTPLGAMCANGLILKLGNVFYYDAYAHLDIGEKYDSSNNFIHGLKKGIGFNYSFGEQPIKVDSCFGGFTIYKTTELLNAKYDLNETDNIECEHVKLHRYMPGKIYMNPSMIHLVLKNE